MTLSTDHVTASKRLQVENDWLTEARRDWVFVVSSFSHTHPDRGKRTHPQRPTGSKGLALAQASFD
jgi:hypothetical protein